MLSTAGVRRTGGYGGGPARGRQRTGRLFAAIWAHSVRDKAIVIAVLGFYGLAIGVGVGALWPPLRGTFAELAQTLPESFDSILGGLSLGTPEGWVNAEMFTMLGLVYAAIALTLGRSPATGA